jgi:hypothetical protein
MGNSYEPCRDARDGDRLSGRQWPADVADRYSRGSHPTRRPCPPTRLLRVTLLAQARLRRGQRGPGCGRRWRAVLARPTAPWPGHSKGAQLRIGEERLTMRVGSHGHGPDLHSPLSRRPDPGACARRRPASRAQSVAPRWPPATLDPGHRRAPGLVIGSEALSYPVAPPHPQRTPESIRVATGAPLPAFPSGGV